MTLLQPAGWARPRGYAMGVSAHGTLVFVSGQIGRDAEGRFAGRDIAAQTGAALRNIVVVGAEAGGHPEHIARLTWYVVDKHEYVAAQTAIGAAYRAVLGGHYPAMSVVAVAALVEDEARVEIEATAVIPACAPNGNAS
ncbi:MAG: RidA family protein [Vulcanimicrobiaceae bacterium]